MSNITVPQNLDVSEVQKLLPHKGKMFLLSRVTSYDAENNYITTEYDVTKDCVFYDEELKGVPSFSGFEIMAQGISALASIKRILRNDLTPPKSGVVLSVTGFEAKVESFSENTTLYMRIREDCCVGNVYKYECRLFLDKNGEEPDVSTFISVMEVEDMLKTLSQM